MVKSVHNPGYEISGWLEPRKRLRQGVWFKGPVLDDWADGEGRVVDVGDGARAGDHQGGAVLKK